MPVKYVKLGDLSEIGDTRKHKKIPEKTTKLQGFVKMFLRHSELYAAKVNYALCGWW